MTTPKEVTFVKNAIHRKDEPRHFMRLKHPEKPVTATFQEMKLASSHNAIKMQEAGFDLYDPVYYFPWEAVNDELLEVSDHTTHCPLKGDTRYYHIHVNGQILENAAFCYAYPIDPETELLKNYLAFDQNRILVIEYLE